MSSFSSKRRPSVGVHPQTGRRYKHVDLTTHPRSRRNKRKSALISKALHAVDDYYTEELGPDPEGLDDLKHEVGRRLRPEIQLDWTQAQADARAIEISEALLAELERELDDSDKDKDNDV